MDYQRALDLQTPRKELTGVWLLVLGLVGAGATGATGRWAVERRFQLLEAKVCWLLRGPFQWTAHRSEAVYRVVIVDGQGERFSGWVCLSNFPLFPSGPTRAEWDGLGKPHSF